MKKLFAVMLLLIPMIAICEVRKLDFNIQCTSERANECIATYKRVIANKSSWHAEFVNYIEEQCQDAIGYVQGFYPNPYDRTGVLCKTNAQLSNTEQKEAPKE